MNSELCEYRVKMLTVQPRRAVVLLSDTAANTTILNTATTTTTAAEMLAFFPLLIIWPLFRERLKFIVNSVSITFCYW